MSTIDEMEAAAKRGVDDLHASMRGFNIAFTLTEKMAATGYTVAQTASVLDSLASEMWGPDWRERIPVADGG